MPGPRYSVLPYVWAWKPGDGDLLGAIGLTRLPSEPLTRQRYRFALMDRIDRMVARAGPSKASEALRIAYDYEGLDVVDRPAIAGEVLVENSDALSGHCCFGYDDIPVDLLIHQPSVLRQIERMTLATFLRKLYGG